MTETETKLAEIREELAELIQAGNEELLSGLRTMRDDLRYATPENLHRHAKLSERLNVLDEVQRIVGAR
jgi:hypothetical protein